MNKLENVILEIIAEKPSSKADFDNIRRLVCGKLKMDQPSNRDLLLAYQNLLKKKRVKGDKQLELYLRKAQIRTLSGVAIVTSLTKPFPCPGNCIYCPSEAKMPKSYLASEPAAARALGLVFDPYEQMKHRIMMLEQSSHPTDKIEYIIKGGSWNAYPLDYQYQFIIQSFMAANRMGKVESRKYKAFVPSSGRGVERRNLHTYKLTHLQTILKIEQKKNETSKHRIVGLTLETRPDLITPETIYHMRQMGCTRIELGLQAPDDKILKLVQRGHTVQQFREAMLLLRQAGFKVDLHFMPDLPGTTPKHDVEMYKQIFSDPGLKPDMIKIYPCTVIKSSGLYQWHKTGKYKPYSESKLFEALIQMKLATPRYCRISRLIRDIPANEISGGNIITNLRENLKKEMHKRGLKCQCLRCREIGHQANTPPFGLSSWRRLHPPVGGDISISYFKSPLTGGLGSVREIPKLFTDKYETTGGTEYFLSFEDKRRQVVFAFLRLRLPNIKNRTNKMNEINFVLSDNKFLRQPADQFVTPNTAFIRELHTYGQLVSINSEPRTKNSELIQHTGFGKKLMLEAEKIAKKNKYKKIAVISGVGVRGYYRKLGYRLEKTYMTKKLP